MVEVREATPEDAEGVARILNAIIATRRYTSMDTPFTLEEQRAFMRAFPARGIFHVAVDGSTEEIVGFQTVDPFASWTRAFDHVGLIGTFVDLGRHRQGIGGRLFKATFHAARGKGYEKLFAYVRADNDAGLHAYQSQGFRVIGTAARHARIDGRYVDEVFIEKALA